jgi:hypothetical protein
MLLGAARTVTVIGVLFDTEPRVPQIIAPYVPGVVPDAAESVTDADSPGTTKSFANTAVTPVGSPVAVRRTVSVYQLRCTTVTIAESGCSGLTVSEGRETVTSKLYWNSRHPVEQLTHRPAVMRISTSLPVVAS